MKKRMGFVSNSSSSSFCIIGIPRKLEEFKDEDFGKEVGTNYKYISGGKVFVTTDINSCEDGIVATETISKEDAKKLSEMKNVEVRFFEVIESFGKNNEKTFSSQELADKILQSDKVTIISGTMDHNFDMNWIEDNYSEI